MSKESTYFQFPLCLLAFGENPQVRLRTILGYCVIVRAKGAFTTEDELSAYVSSLGSSGLHGVHDERGKTENLVAAGSNLLHVQNLRVDVAERRHSNALQFIASSEDLGTTRSLVRIRTDLFWSTLEGRMLYRDFAVLAAVYSSLGANKHPVRVTRDAIIARSLGYAASAFRLNSELLVANRSDRFCPDCDEWASPKTSGEWCLKCGHKKQFLPLTSDQIRWTLDRLEERSLFSRCHIPRSRVTLFSFRLSENELRQAAIGWKLRRLDVAKRRAADREAFDEVFTPKADPERSPESPRLNSGMGAFRGGIPEPEQSPSNPQAVPTESPQTPHASPRFDRNSIETTLETSGESIHRNGEGYALESPSKTNPELESPEPPTLEELKQVAESLFVGSSKYCQQWLMEFGRDDKWKAKPWKKRFASWVANQIQRERTQESLTRIVAEDAEQPPA